MTQRRSRASRFAGAEPSVDLVVGPNGSTRARLVRAARALEALLGRMRHSEPKAHDRLVKEYDLDTGRTTGASRSVVQEGGGWTAHWLLAQQDGVLVARSLYLEPVDGALPVGGISTNLLRELSPASAIAAAGAYELDEVGSVIDRFLADQRAEKADRVIDGRRPTGRPAVPAAELAQVAEAYIEEIKGEVGVTRRLAERLGMPEDTVRDRIRMARSRGFLTPTQKGRRGGTSGPALQAYRADSE